jgi:hypothetical protein
VASFSWQMIRAFLPYKLTGDCVIPQRPLILQPDLILKTLHSKLSHHPSISSLHKAFYAYCRNLNFVSDHCIMVADISQLYIMKPKTCKMELFEK